jgi:hypothetical protein
MVALRRGLTRRSRKLVDAGAALYEVLAAADHVADLLGHPAEYL